MNRIIKKVFLKYKYLKEISKIDFIESTRIKVTNSTEAQFYLGWLMTDFILPGEKTFLSFIRETIKLTKDEITIIKNIENAIIGYFEIISWTKNELRVKDLLTKKPYSISIIDLEKQNLKIIKAKLVKTFDNKYFLFGGIQGFNKKQEKAIFEMISKLFKKTTKSDTH